MARKVAVGNGKLYNKPIRNVPDDIQNVLINVTVEKNIEVKVENNNLTKLY